MAIPWKVLSFLDQNQVPYIHTTHPTTFRALEVAFAEHMSARKVAKVVVFHGDDGYAMAVLPADSVVDMQEMKALLDLPHLRLATEEELAELFPETELGAMPPFGSLFYMPVYVDSTLARQEAIAFNAGTHRDLVHMRFRDFANLVKPTIVSFARRTAA